MTYRPRQQRLPKLPKNPHCDLIFAAISERAKRRHRLRSQADVTAWIKARDRYLAEYAKWEQRERVRLLAASIPGVTTAAELEARA